MASPDMLAVVALMKKAMQLQIAGHIARQHDYRQRALAAAEALGLDDCLIVASLQNAIGSEIYDTTRSQVERHFRGEAPLGEQAVNNVNQRAEHALVLISKAMTTVVRRVASGTLMPGCCRAEEELYERLVHECQQVRYPGDEFSLPLATVALLTGYKTLLEVASTAVVILALSIEGSFDENQALQLLCITLLADTVELFMRPRIGEQYVLSIEGVFVSKMREHLERISQLVLLRGTEGARLLNNWRRLQQSGLLEGREVDRALESHTRCRAGIESAEASAAAAPGLRSCALDSCGARERHPAHFKLCAACKTVAYCSREHQLAGWQAHKAACKAARKAAAANDKDNA